MKRPAKPRRPISAEEKMHKQGTHGLVWPWKHKAWYWDDYQACWHGGPGYQTCLAEMETGRLEGSRPHWVTLETVRWPEEDGDSYEGRVELDNNGVSGQRKFATRLEAQQWSEAELVRLGRMLIGLDKSLR